MSGVYIPNWEKPKSCDECWAEYAYEICNSHSETCPLIPVPDHGDLIDRQEHMKKSGWYNLATGKSIHGAQDYEIASLPTIIPTDKEAGE